MLASAAERILGRENFGRFARWLWMQSRLDGLNDPAVNGERDVQLAVCRTAQCTGRALVAIDVGANVGRWSVDLVELWRSAGGQAQHIELHALEPAADSCAALTSALMTTGASFEVVARAVGATEGRVPFSIVGATAGTNSLAPPDSEGDASVVEVDMTTLDRYCDENDIAEVTMLKIDAEGFDYDVLLGATNLLARHAIDYVQFEYNHRWIANRRYLRDVFFLAEPLGYRVGKITARGIESYFGWHPELESFREGNYLLWWNELPTSLPEVGWWLPIAQR